MSKTTRDSFDNNPAFRSSKRARHNTNVSSTKFKGVVPQQNGHWGAQIYPNHQRIWLGTFKSQKAAAMAYDSASIKLRTGDSHRNFPWNDTTVQEPNFQNQYNIESILSMIRDGSYDPEFADFFRSQSRKDETVCGFSQLFQKELTPSDVGKLNRLVIPKKFAVKHFSYTCESVEDDIELTFYDRLMKPWKFRYCYWRSSKSFVFTRGWNRFVKEKRLKEKDIVTFYACMSTETRAEKFYLIDISYSDGEVCEVDGVHEMKELELRLGQSVGNKKMVEKHEKLESEENGKDEGLRLFGVRIN